MLKNRYHNYILKHYDIKKLLTDKDLLTNFESVTTTNITAAPQTISNSIHEEINISEFLNLSEKESRIEKEDIWPNKKLFVEE